MSGPGLTSSGRRAQISSAEVPALRKRHRKQLALNLNTGQMYDILLLLAVLGAGVLLSGTSDCNRMPI